VNAPIPWVGKPANTDLRAQLHAAVKRGDEAEIERLQTLINEFAREQISDNGDAQRG